MMAGIVAVRRHASYEEDIVVHEDGTLEYRFELDGAACLRKGLEKEARPITLEEIRQRWPHKVAEVERLLP